MRNLIFCLLAITVLAQDMELYVFRYEKGTLKRGNGRPMQIFGSALYMDEEYEQEVRFSGMDIASKTPFEITADDEGSAGFDEWFKCVEINWGLENKRMRGRMILEGPTKSPKISGKCTTDSGETWIFNASTTRSPTLYYTQKEAGLRAKHTIGQSSALFTPARVVNFAILDAVFDRTSCSDFLKSDHPDAPGPEPGAIIVGKDKKHCGIFDNEGTKFIHTNPASKKVTYESIASIERYFPNGVFYKRYPRE